MAGGERVLLGACVPTQTWGRPRRGRRGEDPYHIISRPHLPCKGPDLFHHLGQAARHLDRHRVPGRQVTNHSTASGHVTTIITSDWSGTSPPSPGSTSSWAAPCPSRCTAASCRHPGTLSTIEHPDHCVMWHPYSVILSDIFRELNPPYLHLHDSPVVRIENMDRYCPLCILL